VSHTIYRQRLAGAVAALVAAGLIAVAQRAPAAAVPAPQRMYVSYAMPIRTDGGHVDADKTLDRLKELHVNVHMFLVSNRRDWADLPRFAAKAQQAGIKVWVFLHPPRWCKNAQGVVDRKCPLYNPYHANFVEWGKAIARMSLQHPAVSAWVIDDFVGDDGILTPAYMSRARRASRAIRSALEFYPVVYHQFVNSFMRAYAPLIDALIMPFRDGAYRNTLMRDTLGPHLRADSALVARYRRKLFLMVYTKSLSNTQVVPDVNYVRSVTTAGLDAMAGDDLAGVILFGFPLQPGQPARNDTNFARTGQGALVFGVRSSQRTSALDTAEARVSVAFDAGSTSCVLSFWHKDGYSTSPKKAGYHQKRLMISAPAGTFSQLLWSRDVMTDDATWHRVSLDLSPYVSRVGTLRLRFGLYETKGVRRLGVIAQFDDITLTGCSAVGAAFDGGFEKADAGMYFARAGGPVLVGEHLHDPVYSTTVFTMVERLFQH
jgi:hypothetical protein